MSLGTSLPETVIKAIIDAGFAALKLDQSAVDDLFASQPQAVRDYIKTWVRENTVEARYNFPRPDVKLPAINIILGGADEAVNADLLGDYIGTEEEADPDDADLTVKKDVIAFAENVNYNVLIVATEPELALYLYHLVRRFLFLGRDLLMTTGALSNAHFSGSDTRAEPDYFPEFAYSRTVTVSGLTYFAAKSAALEWLVRAINVVVKSNATQVDPPP